MKTASVSICMPIWKASNYLKEALASLFNQENLAAFDYEIIIGDNTETFEHEEIQKTSQIINSFKSDKIKYFNHSFNMGYPKNLIFVTSKAQKDIIFLMAHDDVLAKNALQKTLNAFNLSDDIGAVTRPYFWFIKDINKPVRVIRPYDSQKDTVLSMNNGKEALNKISETLGQLSALAYRRKYISAPFNDNIFQAHIYPFASILKKYKCVFLKDFTVAVRTESSQTIKLSSIYEKSPLKTWVDMYNSIYNEAECQDARRFGIERIAKHYLGLIQIKNYSTLKYLLREIFYHVWFYPKSLFSFAFWFFSIGTVLIPRRILIPLVNYYKQNINSKTLTDIKFDY